MTFSRVNAGGWASGAEVTTTQFTALDTDLSNALDKSAAGDGVCDDARPSVPPFSIIDELAENSPAAVAGLQLDDRVTAIDNAPTAGAGKELKEAGAWEAKLRGGSGTRVAVSVIRVGWKDPKTAATGE